MKTDRTVTAPKMPVMMEDASVREIGEEAKIYGMRFSGETLDFSAEQTEFYECVFGKVSFTGSLKGCLFADVVFEGCDLSNTDLQNAVLRRVEFRHCRLTGTDMTSSRLQDVLVTDSHAAYFNLNGSRLNRVRFENTVLEHGGFSMCEQKDLQFSECGLNGAEFFQTKLNGVDISDCAFEDITVTPESLRGLTVNAEQAAAFAALFGLIIRQ